ncbi:MAG: zinc ribbon domain-containing protein [Clostridia bacterium]|nr:zinc ribbon domain-containing protein [Clostridia bacterium]
MEWWKIALIALGGLAVLYAGGRAVYRATSGWRSRLKTLKDALDEAIAADKEPPKPRSLSSLESVALPQILKDFPDFNARVFAQRVRRDAKTYYESGMEGKVLFGKDATDTFRETFADRLPENVGSGIDVHRVSLSGYDNTGRRKLLTCQAAAGFSDTTGAPQQRRLVLTYVAGYADDPESEIVGFNCPNCGGPLPAVGARVCVYCGTAFSAPVDRGFLLFDAKEG